MKDFKIKDVIKEIDKIRHLHFASPEKEEFIRKMEWVRPKDFTRVVRILIGDYRKINLNTEDIKIK
jgi:hypothetical protein